MRLNAGLDASAAWLDACAELDHIRFTRLADRRRLVQNSLAGVRKLAEVRCDARLYSAFTGLHACTKAFDVRSTQFGSLSVLRHAGGGQRQQHTRRSKSSLHSAHEKTSSCESAYALLAHTSSARRINA
jgi:hypothetical protein